MSSEASRCRGIAIAAEYHDRENWASLFLFMPSVGCMQFLCSALGISGRCVADVARLDSGCYHNLDIEEGV